ncbi:hypothetical protein M413DRAFT_338704 [Hebeloma cylindrosporum]|uniref:Uncharacterized protein n=1 Tax=Hebeloma cylindrosporum TaxID=76867 RepID=A0A0C3CNH1_HEBCY|nr:hypothetical protein M413DRAFT_338704 [Hebeloma cylindrosporum h7]
MFSNCSNVLITGGVFTHVEQHGVKLTGLDLLHKEVAAGALHNSGERFDPPKCHPNTRVVVLAKILDWVLNNAGRDALIICTAPQEQENPPLRRP